MNRETSAVGGGVKVAAEPFTLAVTGDNIGAVSYKKTGSTYTGTALNDMPGGIGAENGNVYTYSGTTYYKADGADVIKWRLAETYDPKDDGIGPDSNGSFTFYIIPNVDTGFKVKVCLSLDGYKAKVSRNEDKNDADHNGTYLVEDLALIGKNDSEYESVEFLNRRMLFFNTGTKGSYNKLLDKDGFELTFEDEDVSKGVPIEITVSWIWPRTFAQMACIAASDNIIDPALPANADTIAQVRDYIVSEPDKLLSPSKISKADALNKMADSDGNDGYTFNTTKANANIVALSEGYNVADNAVGKDVKYFLLNIVVEQAD